VNNEAVAGEVAQETGVSIEQVNECLNGTSTDETDDTDNGDTDTADTDTADTDSSASAAAVDDPDAVRADSIPEVKALVNTGGPSLLGLAVISLAVSVVGISVLTGWSRR
jgi:hypothetical protein